MTTVAVTAADPFAADPVTPIAYQRGVTLHGVFTAAVYPSDTVSVGDQVRRLRIGNLELPAYLTLHKAAKLAGLHPKRLSDIEFGRVRLRDAKAAVLELRRVWAMDARNLRA